MPKMPRLTLIVSIIALITALIGFRMVSAFAEEHLSFIDPESGETNSAQEVSSLHFDLTEILALAAGFSVADAHTLMIYNQLVDSETLGPESNPQAHTNCIGSFQPTPDPKNYCGPLQTHLIWPREYDTTCTTSRFGPYSPFFHFPHNTTTELGQLREWAWGRSQQIIGYGAYAWDNSPLATVLTADCIIKPTETIETGITPGSLPAFATYLHSLADFYSHFDCQYRLDTLPDPAPWGTHTLPLSPQTYYECEYNPLNPTDTDAHGREFGTAVDTLRTEAAIDALYAELSLRARSQEGIYTPLSLQTPLPSLDGAPTLEQALDAYVHNWIYSEAAARRTYLQMVKAAILSLSRESLHHAALPLLAIP